MIRSNARGGRVPETSVKFARWGQQCGNAPCERLCPTYAARKRDGLNAQSQPARQPTRLPAVHGGSSTSSTRVGHAVHLQLNPTCRCEKGAGGKGTSRAAHQGGRHPGQADETPLKDGDIKPSCAQSCRRRRGLGDWGPPRAPCRAASSPRAARLEDWARTGRDIYQPAVGVEQPSDRQDQHTG